MHQELRLFSVRAVLSVLVMSLTGCGGGGGPSPSVQPATVSFSASLPSKVVAGRTAEALFTITAHSNLRDALILQGLNVPTSGQVTVGWQAPPSGTACRNAQGQWARLKAGQSCSQVVTFTGAAGAKINIPWTLQTSAGSITLRGALNSTHFSSLPSVSAAPILSAVFVSSSDSGLPTLNVDQSILENGLTLEPNGEVSVTITNNSPITLNNVRLQLASWLVPSGESKLNQITIPAQGSVTFSFTVADTVDLSSHLKDIEANAQTGSVLSIVAANSRGASIKPTLQVNTTPGTLSDVTLSQPGTVKSTFTNTGQVPVTITGISGDLPTGVTLQSNECTDKTIAPKGSCEISYQASASARGSSTQILSYQDEKGKTFQSSAKLTVTPITVQVSASNDPVARGDSTTFTVKNTGPFTWYPSGDSSDYQITDANDQAVSDLTITGNSCSSQSSTGIAKDGTCTLTVKVDSNATEALHNVIIAPGSGNLAVTAKETFGVQGEASMLEAGWDESTSVDDGNRLDPAVKRIKVENVGESAIKEITATLSNSMQSNASTAVAWVYDGTNGASANNKGAWCTASSCPNSCSALSSSGLAAGESCYEYVYANPKAAGLKTGDSKSVDVTIKGSNSINEQTLSLTNHAVLYAGTEGNNGSYFGEVREYKDGSWGTNALKEFNSWINALAVGPSGELYVGGQFVRNGQYYVAKYDENGGGWSDIGGDQESGGTKGFNSSIYTLAVGSEGELYAGGGFTHGNHQTYVAKYANGSWSDIGGDQTEGSGGSQTQGFNYGLIRALVVSSESELYAGGDFINGNDQQYVAKYDENSGGWSEVGEDQTPARTKSFNGSTRALAVSSDGELYVGGQFVRNGQYYVAKYDENGGGWSDIGGDQESGGTKGFNSSIYTLAVSSDGELYVGGDFTNDNSQTYVAKYDKDLDKWSDIEGDRAKSGAGGNTKGFNGTIYTLAVAPDGELYAGGGFSNDNSQNYVAKYDGDGWESIGGNFAAGTSWIYTLKTGNEITIASK